MYIAAKSGYCTSTSIPPLANAQYTATSGSVGTVLAYTCNNGYYSFVSPSPYVTCVAYTSAQGSWANIVGACYRIIDFPSDTTATNSCFNEIYLDFRV